MIASHYAEPLEGMICRPTGLRSVPMEDAPIIRELTTGEPFALLDDSIGWAWGYAGEERRVGYIRSDALTAY